MKQAIYDAIRRSKTELPRPHLGASIIGEKCRRKIWLSFRWAIKSDFDGRLLRIFRRGHQEEPNVIADMRLAGVVFANPSQLSQVGFKDGHFAGSADNVILSGLPDYAGQYPLLLEIKTSNKARFVELEKDGLRKARPQHYAQMQVYMLKLGLLAGLYLCVCKDDDNIYTETIALDTDFAMLLTEKAYDIATSDHMPPPLSENPTWYECKMCNYHAFCHKTRITDSVNCRTCAKSTAKRDGDWFCERWQDNIPVHAQYNACRAHVLHPELVPWSTIGQTDTSITYQVAGNPVPNGHDGFASTEILANPELCAQQDAVVAFLRDNMGGEITE